MDFTDKRQGDHAQGTRNWRITLLARGNRLPLATIGCTTTRKGHVGGRYLYLGGQALNLSLHTQSNRLQPILENILHFFPLVRRISNQYFSLVGVC